MTFEFLIACHITPDLNVSQTLTDLLTGILADNQNDFNQGMLADMIRIRHRRSVGQDSDSGETTGGSTLIGFVVELPEDTRDVEAVITAFANALPETPSISHTLKFEDPLLEAYLVERASEIFALEMKLRRVLSLVYLNAYQFEAPFDLLREENEENLPIQRPQDNQMRAAVENQFFHLVFSQYANLNQRQALDLSALLDSIQNSNNYDALHAEISRLPIGNEEDASFIASLKDIIGPIGRMRNCVAHNRRPSVRIKEDYPNARDQLDTMLDEFLAGWEPQEQE